jgi:hypothetical protein
MQIYLSVTLLKGTATAATTKRTKADQVETNIATKAGLGRGTRGTRFTEASPRLLYHRDGRWPYGNEQLIPYIELYRTGIRERCAKDNVPDLARSFIEAVSGRGTQREHKVKDLPRLMDRGRDHLVGHSGDPKRPYQPVPRANRFNRPTNACDIVHPRR